MKLIFIFIVSVLGNTLSHAQLPATSIYNFELPSLIGNEPINLSAFKGKKILIINTAFESDSINQLKSIIRQLKKDNRKDLVVVFCPSNSFNHEKGTIENLRIKFKGLDNENIKISAPVFVTGNQAHPLFNWFASLNKNGVMNARVYDDFNKFLIDENGVFVGFMGKSESAGSYIMSKMLQ